MLTNLILAGILTLGGQTEATHVDNAPYTQKAEETDEEPVVDTDTPAEEPDEDETIEGDDTGEDGDTTGNSEETTEEEEGSFNWQEWIAKNVATLLGVSSASVLTLIASIVGLVSKLKQLAKEKNLTLENVKDAVIASIKENLTDEMKKEIEPILEKVQTTVANQAEVAKVFTKIVALSQSNDPNSKIAILECIASLGVVDKTIIEEGKASIEEEEAKETAKKEETEKIVNDIISETSNGDDGTTI
jgi:ribosomal protein L17